jgi:uncharacterized alkaline shock family protein YloU
MQRKTEYGTTTIDDAILATIATEAALATPGVVRLATRRRVNGKSLALKNSEAANGVEVVAHASDGYSVYLHVIVAYGLSIASVGRELSRRVTDALVGAVGEEPRAMTIQIEGVQRVE